MMKNLSLYHKIFLVFIIGLVLSVGIVGWFGMKSASQAYLDSAYALREQSTQSLKVEIEDSLKDIPNDILNLSNSYALSRFLIWDTLNVDRKSSTWKRIFSDNLIDFLVAQKSYSKLRIISKKSNEIISVLYDNHTDSTSLVPSEDLQNKTGRRYAEEPKKLKRGEFYVSAMNLDIEFGKIKKPYLPIIRYATPVINKNGKLVAVFVGSVYADNVLHIIEKERVAERKDKVEYYLIDSDGDYLYNADKEKRWNKQLKNGATFSKDFFDFKTKFADKEHGTFELGSKIYSFAKVYPLQQDRSKYYYLISSVDTSIALAKLDDFKILFFTILLLVFLLSYFIVRAFVLKLTTPMTQVTEQLQALSVGEIKKTDIAYTSNDEIGNIVKSTAIVVDAIERTISQANAVADGNFTREIELLGENDALGIALRSMTQRLKEITNLAENLSVGDYDVQVVAKNGDDKLGLALVNMVEYLATIASATESIALGELHVKYKVRGGNDRLGFALLKMITYLNNVLQQANAISNEDFSNTIEIKSQDDELGIALTRMTEILSTTSKKNSDDVYFSEGIAKLSDQLAGSIDPQNLAKNAITLSSRYVGASSGTLYTFDKESETLTLLASYAFTTREKLSQKFTLGEGIIGQVALEKEPILLTNVKDEEFYVQSATTIAKPKEVYAFPLIHDGELFGVAEIMSFESFTPVEINYLSKSASTLATALHTSSQNVQIKNLLEKSQQAFEELQTQSEELQESNTQMEEQQQQLKLQSHELQIKNETLATAKKEIDQRAEDLETASKYKSEFLANMSHELRTPLNSIILLSKLLTQNQNKTLDEKDVEKSAVINKAGNDLLFLINDILDLSKIESGQMELIYEDIESKQILDDMQGYFGAVAQEKNIDFKIVDNFNSAFSTDRVKLAQVLKNLLSNALKFTKEGSVTLKIEKDSDSLIISVADSGIGIPKDKLETIFEAFKQVDGSISREFGGTGLGLSISKTIVDLMNGELSVESELHKGATFRVKLPLFQQSPAPKPEHKRVESSEKIETVVEDVSIVHEEEENELAFEDGLNGKNILIVDDDSRNIFTLTSTLESMDAEVFSAFNGKEALELLEDEHEKIDVILMDIMMPVMDGLSAIKIIREHKKFKHIPIIAVTAKTMPEDKQECLDAGANDYLAKPLHQNALFSMIKAWTK